MIGWIRQQAETLVNLSGLFGFQVYPVYREQVELAMKLIDTKSQQNDIKALNDVSEINLMIKTAKPTIEFVSTAKQLDKRINEDYPEIEEMHNIASNMANPAVYVRIGHILNMMQF